MHPQVNHFAILTNSLTTFPTLQHLNAFLTTHGFELNPSGGVVKGQPTELLEQSSTMAPYIEGVFDSTTHPIMGCYYEFARRYPLPLIRGGGDGECEEGVETETAGAETGARTRAGAVDGAVDGAVGAVDGAGARAVTGAVEEEEGRSDGQSDSIGRFGGLFQGFIPASADKIFESTYEKKT